jgi:hypothetical protein
MSTLYFCINSEAHGKEYLEKLFSIGKINKYTLINISRLGNFILIQGPTNEEIAKTPEGVSFDPGGLKRLYNQQGSLLWEKMYSGFLEFCSNESYLMEPSPDDVEGLYPPTVYDRKDGALFFRMPEKRPEVNSFDVRPKGEMILAGLWNGKVMLIHKGKKAWDYFTGIPSSVDVAFSREGGYFVEDIGNTLFKIDKDGGIHKIDIPIKEKKLASFNYEDLKDTIHFVLAIKSINEYTPKIYQYAPQENRFFFLDLSYVAGMTRKFVLEELRKTYHIEPRRIEFSKFLDHLGVITTDDTFYYFKIKGK